MMVRDGNAILQVEIPEALKREVKAAAAIGGATLQAYVEAVLRRSVSEDPTQER